MTPRPLHTMNESSSSSIHQIDELVTAKNRFYDNISKGISVLVGKHGYSRERAASLILDQIRLTDEAPIDDEVFRVMHHLGLGFEGARQSIVVASALKRVQKEQGIRKASAIDYLSSCLTTMKLLGSVEKNASIAAVALDCSPASAMSEEFMSSTLDNSTSGPGASIEPAAPSTNTKSRKTNVGRRMTSKNNLKNKSRQSKPLKPPRKRSKDDDSIPSSKVDAQVVEKALLVNVNRASSSPSVRQTSKRVGSHRDELDIQSQPAPKRQRLDSI